jgi:hypothetical protein
VNVGELARAIYEDAGCAQNWAIRWRSLIYESQLNELLTEGRTAAGPTPSEAAQRELAYLEHNPARMDYRHYREQGWFIGSGVVEAGCMLVIGQRLKQSGMFWRESGASALASLRWALLSAGGLGPSVATTVRARRVTKPRDFPATHPASIQSHSKP